MTPPPPPFPFPDQIFPGTRQRTRLTPVFVQRLFEEVVTYKVPPSSSSSSSSSPSSSSPPPVTSGVEEEVAEQSQRSGGSGSGDAADGVSRGGEDIGTSPGMRSGDEREERGGKGAGRRRATKAEGEMDYKTFLDLLLAMENKQTKQARRRGAIERFGGEGRGCAGLVPCFCSFVFACVSHL